MKQEFVTLPRAVVERALEALFTYKPMVTGVTFQHGLEAMQALRAALEQPDHSEQSYMGCVTSDMHELAEWLNTMYEDSKEQIAALEQPQNHVPDTGNMVQAGWKLVPVEPTREMLDAYIHMQGRFSSARSDWAAMLAAAPQPQTTEQSSAVEQQQGEQEPAVEHELKDVRCECCGYMTNHREHMGCIRAAHTKREPLENEQARRIYNSATYSASLAVFMTRIDAEHPDADDKGVSGWLQEAEDRVKHRTIDAAHEIGQAAAPQQGEQEPVFWYRPVGEDGGYEGPIHNSAIERVRRLSGAWVPLVPSQQPPYHAYLLRDLADDISVDALDLIAEIRDAGLGNYSINMKLPTRVCVAMCQKFSDAQQPQVEQEPVATLHCTEECYVYARATDAGKRIRFEQPIDLYTHPQPKREPLTHYEIHELFRRSWDDCQDGDEIKAFARAIEAAHNIK